MPRSALTIQLEHDDAFVTVESLNDTLAKALELLRSMERDFASSDSPVTWVVVRASMKSPLMFSIGSQPNGREAERLGNKIVEATFRGIKRIEKLAKLPRHFQEESLEAAQDMIRAARRGGAQLTLRLDDRRQQVTPTDKALRHIAEIVARVRVYEDYGTIEGLLDVVSVRGHPHVYVSEFFANLRLECATESKHLFDEAVAMIGKRVSVSGRIRYRDHRPKIMNLESITELPAPNTCPQPSEIGPINITDGLSSEEYVRRIRDAQSRLYIYPDAKRQVIHVITLGDKTTQENDIKFCTGFVQSLQGEVQSHEPETPLR